MRRLVTRVRCALGRHRVIRRVTAATHLGGGGFRISECHYVCRDCGRTLEPPTRR